MSRDQVLERLVGRRRRVLQRLAGTGRGEPFLDEAREDVVHALPGQPGQARGLGRGGRVAAEEREIRPRLVARKTKPLETLQMGCVHELELT